MIASGCYQAIFDRLGAIRWGKDGVGMCRCPAHDDRRPSLAIRVKEDDGRLLLKCHAGCTVAAICRALGIHERDLFPPRDEPAAPATKPTVACTYDYFDEHGELLFQVVRMVPKAFHQRRPDGKGGWVSNMQGVRRVVYHLPELVAEPGRCAFVVEGEKAADRLAGLGFLATTNPGGAGKWLPDYAPAFRGRPVVLIPDHDEAGYKQVAQVAAHLHPVAQWVRIVELPGQRDKGGADDWIDGFMPEVPMEQRAELLRLVVRKTPNYGDGNVQVAASVLRRELARVALLAQQLAVTPRAGG